MNASACRWVVTLVSCVPESMDAGVKDTKGFNREISPGTLEHIIYSVPINRNALSMLLLLVLVFVIFVVVVVVDDVGVAVAVAVVVAVVAVVGVLLLLLLL